MKKERVVFIFSRLFSTYVSLQKLYFFWRLYPPPKSADRFLKKWSCNPPCALKLWLLYVEHKNKYYYYYYSIELELMLYIRCQRAWDQSFSFQYRRFLCDENSVLFGPENYLHFTRTWNFWEKKVSCIYL